MRKWLRPKRPHCIISYQKLKGNMLCLPVDPVVLCETIGRGKLLCRAQVMDHMNRLGFYGCLEDDPQTKGMFCVYVKGQGGEW